MSRSTNLSELKAGAYLVIVSEKPKRVSNDVIAIRIATHDDKKMDVKLNIHKELFLKFCYAIDSIDNDLIFDSEIAEGKRFWACIKEVWTRVGGEVSHELFDALPYSETMPQLFGNPMTGEIGGPFIEVLNTGSKALSEAEKKAFIEQTKKQLTKQENFDEI
jgi:hypothetical protein